MHQRHVDMLNQTATTLADLEAAATTLRRLERFWMHGSQASAPRPEFAA